MANGLQQTKGDLVALPPPGQVSYFTDASGNLKQVDENGNITSVGGSTAPTGTGFVHVTGGVQDPAAVAAVAMADQIAVAGGDVTDLTLSGLTGDADGNWEVNFGAIYKGGSGAESLYFRIAANDTNMLSWIRYDNGSSTTVTSSNNTGLIVADVNNASDTLVSGHYYMTTKSGRIRWITGTSHMCTTGGGFFNFGMTGHFNDTATVLTQLTLHAAVASSIRSGSYLAVRQLKQNF